MNVPVVDLSDAATLAAAEGQAALGVGDTALARQKYAEAGAILEREMKVRHGGSEKQLLRFLAATQYYKGGDYPKARELANKIDARVLPKNVRGLLPQFLKDVKLRAAPEYAMSIRKTLHSFWGAQKPREAIAILQEHPYVVDAAALAFMRATLCDQLLDFRASALFFAAALRYSEGDVQIAYMTVVTPLNFLRQGRIAEAWECVQRQLEYLPHPVTYTTASIVCYHRFVAATSGDRKKPFEEQLTFVEKAWDAYQKLDAKKQNHPDMQAYMAFGFDAAVGTWLLQGNKERGKEVWERATKFRGNAASPWTTHDFAPDSSQPADRVSNAEYLSEREAHFSERFAAEPSIRQQLEVVGV